MNPIPSRANSDKSHLPNNNHSRAEPAQALQRAARTCKTIEIARDFFEFLRFWSNFFRENRV